MRVFCDVLGVEVEIPEHPQRIVCLVSSLTETLFEMGCAHRLAGISAYCHRYIPPTDLPVVGDYLRVDESLLSQIAPDLIIVTTGVQRALGQRLVKAGYPVYALPLPSSISGVMENVNLLGGLVNEVESARRLRQRWEQQFQTLCLSAPVRRPRVYIELWFGRHMRTVGALSFIHDLVEAAGGDNIFGRDRRAYFVPDFAEVERQRPDVLLFHTEPDDYPVDVAALIEERGWHQWNPAPYVVIATVNKGQNIIHEGPSMMETATWLQGHFHFWARHYR
ncbi:MAG: ABC transporter substrate-binding protein [Chthonomonadetes bacterium]|nr:ABC transporter substrate-binding protein [Chthonomonadetes bacterium]